MGGAGAARLERAGIVGGDDGSSEPPRLWCLEGREGRDGRGRSAPLDTAVEGGEVGER